MDGEWQFEVLEEDGAGPVSIALDGNGGAHVAFAAQDGLGYFAPSSGRQIINLDFCVPIGNGFGADGSPRVVTNCGVHTMLGAYPDTYYATCDGFAASVCTAACACTAGNECCYNTTAGAQTCWTGDCEATVIENFCSSSFADPADMTTCADDYAAQGPNCVSGFEALPGSCQFQ